MGSAHIYTHIHTQAATRAGDQCRRWATHTHTQAATCTGDQC